MPEACSAKCPNYDAEKTRVHAKLKPNDAELLAALRSFADWLYEPGQRAVEDQILYAASLYTRADHEGTCIPKTLLFAHYKSLQFSPYGELKFRKEAEKALRGKTVASWPDGERASGLSWNEMFAAYTRRYDDEA